MAKQISPKPKRLRIVVEDKEHDFPEVNMDASTKQ